MGPTLQAAWDEERKEPTVAALVSVAIVQGADSSSSSKDASEITALKKQLETLKNEAKRDRDTNRERYTKFTSFKKGYGDEDGYGSDGSSSGGGNGKGKGGKGRKKGGRGSGEEPEEPPPAKGEK